MKVVLFLIGMAAAGMLGYILEPSYRQQLTGQLPGKVAPVEPQETISEPAAPARSFDDLQPNQLPASVTLKAPLKVNDPQSGTSMTLDPGSRLKPLRVEAGKLVVRVGESGPAFPVAIPQTDLAEQLAANPPPAVTTTTTTTTTSTETTNPFGSPSDGTPAIPAPAVEPAPAITPAPAPAGESTTPAAEPPPVPAPAPIIPIPAPAPVTGGGESSAAAGGPVAAMQQHIRSGSIKEFQFDQVVDWKEGPAETIDGAAYQTGTATYKAETIFGARMIVAKALVKDGKVVRWVWPKSGMEIR